MEKEKQELKRTPFYECHVEAGGKLVPFAGWELPVQYKGLIQEHEAVRNRCGIFDVSHMGEIFVSGKGADNFVDHLVTNRASALSPGEISYTPMCMENGGIVDDLLVYHLGVDNFLLVVNAANIEKDYQWILKNAPEEVKVDNQSENWAQLAVQGPEAEKIIRRIFGDSVADLKGFNFIDNINHNGLDMIISRTGYTGEDGFEIYISLEKIQNINDKCSSLWHEIVEAGSDCNLVPAGLGARDTLRFEAKLMLYGNEITEETTPLEARIGWTIFWDKPEFIGREAILKQKEEGLNRKLMGLKLVGKGVPRHGYSLLSSEGEKIGVITSGTFSPTFKEPLALGYVPSKGYKIGTHIAVEIRGKAVEAVIVKTPFYKRA